MRFVKLLLVEWMIVLMLIDRMVGRILELGPMLRVLRGCVVKQGC